jgi:CRP/FNR family transcriptional regulator, cyclic AMP receptor protein
VTTIDLFRHDRDTIEVPAGVVIFRQGDVGDSMYAVVEGSVEIISHGVTVEVIETGGIVGELALIDNSPRSATAVARTDARLAHINRERFTELVRNHPTFALRVMQVMAARLRHTDELLG